MSDTTLFSTETATPEPVAVQSLAVPSIPAEVAELVGEGKKYKSVDDALKALPHAQSHIARLEQEAKELREKAAQARAIEDVYEALQSRQSADPVTAAVPAFDERTLDVVLERKLQEKQAMAVKQANMNEVKQALTDKFGDKASETFRKKAEELGVNEVFLTDLIAASSKAGLELFGLVRKDAPASAAPAGGINTQAIMQNQQPVKPKAIMGGATTSDMIQAWRASNPVKQ